MKSKTHNFKLIADHHDRDIIFGSIYFHNLNREVEFMFKSTFDIDMRSFDGHSQFDRIDVDIKWIEFDHGAEQSTITLNERNMKMIKQMIVDKINNAPESFGVDFEDEDLHWNDDEPTIFNTIYSGYPSRIHCDKF